MTSKAENLTRRDFLRNTSLAAAGTLATMGMPSILHAQTKQTMNAVVIGGGGRGRGAGMDFMNAAKIVGVDAKILGVAEAFSRNLDGCVREWGKQGVEIPKANCFVGLDAYMKALEIPGVNYVIIATPPGFKPAQVKAAIDQGKNVFTEKPVAADAPGCRIMYAAGEAAAKKGLKVAAGTQRRHQAGYIETIKRLQDGAIGDISFMRAYWVNGGPIWHRGENGATDLEKQVNNWYHYIWLSGDHICEQHVHNLDVCNWVMGNQHPVKCWGQGSRQQLGNSAGEIWDNFAIEYEYANGVRMYSYCGQIKRGWASVSESIHGTKGTSNPGGSISIKGGERWRSSLQLPAGPYVQEHVDLIKSILNNTELNEIKNVTDSTLTAIMGREAAYSGEGVEWDTLLNSNFKYGPELLYSDAAKMEWGKFRTLKPPVPSRFNTLKDPPMAPTVAA